MSITCLKIEKKISLKSDFIHIFYAFMHVYSIAPGQTQTTP